MLSSSSNDCNTAPKQVTRQVHRDFQGLLFQCGGTGTQNLLRATVEDITFRGRVLGKLQPPSEQPGAQCINDRRMRVMPGYTGDPWRLSPIIVSSL